MVFSAPIHQDPLLVIEIVDDAWAAETLPVEDVVVAPTEMTNLEEDEPTATQDDDDEDKWNDLALDEYASHISGLTYHSDSDAHATVRATGPRGTQR